MQAYFDLSMIYAAAFIVAALAIRNKQALTAMIYCLSCQALYASPIYHALTASQLHIAYACIAFTAIRFVSGFWLALALFMSALFQTLMAWDAYVYSTTQTWLYSNYELISALLHAAVIVSCVEWRGAANSFGRHAWRLRVGVWNLCRAMPV